MRVLMATIGSHGDVLPFVALATEFQARGHTVRLYTNPLFETLVHGAGIDFAPVATAELVESFLTSPDSLHSLRGLRRIAEGIDQGVPELYAAMDADVDPGNTVTVGSTLAFAPRLLWETRGVPTATLHLAPSLLRSNRRLPRMTAGRPWQGAPTWLNRAIWRAADALFLDRLFAPPLNRCRSKLGLAPVKRVWDRWLHEGDLVVGMFPDWFAPPQPDWPDRLELTGFPLYDNGAQQPLADSLQAFLEAGTPAVAFTAGTATAAAPSFYAAAAEACRRLGRRGILLSRYSGHLPRDLPPNVIHVDYAPFGALLPRLAAFVHHGGIGSTSQALRAGVPQLVRPAAYDQFDNADRVVRLGVGRELLAKRFKATTVATELDRLIDDRALHARCAQVAARLTDSDAVARTCDLVLQRLVSKLDRSSASRRG